MDTRGPVKSFMKLALTFLNSILLVWTFNNPESASKIGPTTKKFILQQLDRAKQRFWESKSNVTSYMYSFVFLHLQTY